MPHFNQKDQRILKLWERGMKSKSLIARKIGYGEANMAEGVKRVEEGLKRLGCLPSDELPTNNPNL